MQAIFFVYGLAFLILAIIIFLTPKRRDFLDIESQSWLIGLFALAHSLNEWLDLFILRGEPFSVETLKMIRGFLLPLSFLFLVAFGTAVLTKESRRYRWLNGLFLAIAVLWLLISIFSNDPAHSDIFARYLICTPGAILTALGLFIALKRARQKNIPRSVRAFTMIASGVFVLYGLFAGIIVPAANFFPANILNYDNFSTLSGLPVQFFRMLCALLLTVSFFVISGAFTKEKGSPKEGIKRKLIIIICSSIILVVLIGSVLVYVFGYRILQDVIGVQNEEYSRLLGEYTTDEISSDVEDAKVYTTLSLWTESIRNANLRYKDMSTAQMDAYFKEMDKKWIQAKADDPILREYLENRVGLVMNNIVKLRRGVSEIFITDRYGGVVAASEKTSDFYQADETWWQEAYNNGKGKIYLSSVEFDESSSMWVMSIAIPFKDDKGDVIGICKESMSAQRIFSILKLFRIGKTGRACLVDQDGNILYNKYLTVPKGKYLNAENIKKLLARKEAFFASERGVLRDKSAFFAYSVVKPPYLSARSEYWVMFVIQDQDEVLEPLYKLVSGFTLIALLLIIIALPISAFFGGMIAMPIRELRAATERVMAGDWDYKVSAHTGDEIEEFADSFGKMVASIKDKQLKLEDFSRGLEDKVRARTKELYDVQEATLNILEDLEDSKKKLEMSNKELKQLDQLKSDFISTVSHELRTPLSIIKEGVSLVIDKVPGEINEKQARILDISKFNIDRLARIIDSLLDISKIEAGKIELKRSLIDISEIVKQVADSFQMKIKEKSLELKIDIDKDAGKIYADPDRISQVLINLIGNAVKFTQSGFIEVSCKGRKDTVVCSVKDTGPGIAKSDLPRLFDKFQQFGRLAGAGEKGTGLGLSIAKGIIDMHDGYITVESELAVGSCFTFSLHRYTELSLFTKFTAKAISSAAATRSKASIIILQSKWKKDFNDASSMKAFHNAMADCSRAINNTLRRQGDEIVSNDADILVILADCGKEHSLLVRQRLEQILNKFLEEKKIRQKLDTQYGCATYPEDGETEIELISRAYSGICSSRAGSA